LLETFDKKKRQCDPAVYSRLLDHIAFFRLFFIGIECFSTIPLTEDIDEYFEREIRPFNSEAWIDKKKTKVGYEIPFTRLFYKYQTPEKSEDIAKRISEIEARIVKSFEALSGEEVEVDDE